MHHIARVSPRGIPHFQTRLHCRCGPHWSDRAAVYTKISRQCARACAGEPASGEIKGFSSTASSQIRRTSARGAPYGPGPDGKVCLYCAQNQATCTAVIVLILLFLMFSACLNAVCIGVLTSDGGSAQLGAGWQPIITPQIHVQNR